jgi:hypothetical protein
MNIYVRPGRPGRKKLSFLRATACWQQRNEKKTFCWMVLILIGWRATLKMVRRKSKMQFVKREHSTQNASVFLNYLKHIAPQQCMLRTQFSQKIFSAKKATTTL